MINDNLKSKVLEILEKEQNELDGCFDSPTDVTAPSKLERTSVTQNADGTWNKVIYEEPSNLVDNSIDQINRNQIVDKATTLREFCQAIDNKIISINGQIGVKKQEIVTLSLEASNGNCWPGIAYSSPPFDNISTDYGTVTTLKQDVENLRIYPKMAGPQVDYGAQNVFEPDAIYTLSPTYSGYGYQNLPELMYYKNKDGSLTGLRTDGSGTLIGNGRFDISTNLSDHSQRIISNPPEYRYYFGPDNPPDAARCVAIANSISSIYNEIIQLRIERDSLRTDLNTIKKNKSEKELSAWGINRINHQVDSRKTINASAISAVMNYASDVTIDNDSQLVLNLDAGDTQSYSGIGTNWYDLSGNGNDATLENGPLFVVNAIEFDGVNDFATSGALSGSFSSFSVIVWFYPTSVTNYENVIDCNYAYNGSTGNIGPRLEMNNSGSLAWNYSNDTSNNNNFYSHEVLSTGLASNTWHCAAITYDGTTNTSKTYYNGSNTGKSRALIGSPTGFVGVMNNVILGKGFHLGGAERIFTGRISIASIYRSVLTDSQILQNFNQFRSRFTI